MKTHITYLSLVLIVMIPNYSISQVFEWCADGYTFGGGIFQNIDYSNIDVEISGLYDDDSI